MCCHHQQGRKNNRMFQKAPVYSKNSKGILWTLREVKAPWLSRGWAATHNTTAGWRGWRRYREDAPLLKGGRCRTCIWDGYIPLRRYFVTPRMLMNTMIFSHKDVRKQSLDAWYWADPGCGILLWPIQHPSFSFLANRTPILSRMAMQYASSLDGHLPRLFYSHETVLDHETSIQDFRGSGKCCFSWSKGIDCPAGRAFALTVLTVTYCLKKVPQQPLCNQEAGPLLQRLECCSQVAATWRGEAWHCMKGQEWDRSQYVAAGRAESLGLSPFHQVAKTPGLSVPEFLVTNNVRWSINLLGLPQQNTADWVA